MGDLTANLDLYKPATTEFVDVNTQLNRNWEILDTAAKRLMEYEYVTDPVPNVTGSVDRPKFYKSYSNSVMTYFQEGRFFWQSPSSPVNSWTSGKSWLTGGYKEYPNLPVFVRENKVISGATKREIEWAGAIQLNDGDIIPTGTTIIVMPDGSIPAAFRPTRSQYFTTWAGNTSTNYSIARVFVSFLGRIEIRRYGSNPTAGSVESRIELTGIKYDAGVTG